MMHVAYAIWHHLPGLLHPSDLVHLVRFTWSVFTFFLCRPAVVPILLTCATPQYVSVRLWILSQILHLSYSLKEGAYFRSAKQLRHVHLISSIEFQCYWYLSRIWYHAKAINFNLFSKQRIQIQPTYKKINFKLKNIICVSACLDTLRTARRSRTRSQIRD
jgi:hypothetical protein